MIYTVWKGDHLTLYEGEDPHRFPNGDLSDPEAKPIAVIQADSWDEANHLYHRLMGWEAYKPMEE